MSTSATSSTGPVRITATALDGVPEVRSGDDLADLLLAALAPDTLRDGDVVVVTSKVVAKAEGRVVAGDREEHLAAETARVVARRGPTTIVRTHHGLTLAAAGIDASNVATGAAVLLPRDPDASARALRRALAERTGAGIGVVVTDTAGRAWREGQTDIAIGAAGVVVAESFEGRVDGFGNELVVTLPAVADELAGLAELASGKLGGRPFVVVRGRPDLVLAVGDDGPGAAALVRADHRDLFGYGAREAVLRAVTGTGIAPFGTPVAAAELRDVLEAALGTPADGDGDGDGVALDVAGDPALAARATVLAFAHGWVPEDPASDGDLRFRPVSP